VRLAASSPYMRSCTIFFCTLVWCVYACARCVYACAMIRCALLNARCTRYLYATFRSREVQINGSIIWSQTHGQFAYIQHPDSSHTAYAPLMLIMRPILPSTVCTSTPISICVQSYVSEEKMRYSQFSNAPSYFIADIARGMGLWDAFKAGEHASWRKQCVMWTAWSTLCVRR
jgi:hypothetical protein